MNAPNPGPRNLVEQARTLVVWVFRDGEDQWSLRREGDLNEHRFGCRDDAVAFAYCLANISSGYKLFIQLPSGRFIIEYRGYYTGSSRV